MKSLVLVVATLWIVGLSRQGCVDYGEFFKSKDELVESWKIMKTTYGA
jgi:hypothetical protein